MREFFSRFRDWWHSAPDNRPALTDAQVLAVVMVLAGLIWLFAIRNKTAEPEASVS